MAAAGAGIPGLFCCFEKCECASIVLLASDVGECGFPVVHRDIVENFDVQDIQIKQRYDAATGHTLYAIWIRTGRKGKKRKR